MTVIHANRQQFELAKGIRGAFDAAAFETDMANRMTAAQGGQRPYRSKAQPANHRFWMGLSR